MRHFRMVVVIKIDKQGRLLLPKEIGEKYHLGEGTEMVVTEAGDGINLSPRKGKKRLADVFGQAPSFDPARALAIDIANLDDDEP